MRTLSHHDSPFPLSKRRAISPFYLVQEVKIPICGSSFASYHFTASTVSAAALRVSKHQCMSMATSAINYCRKLDALCVEDFPITLFWLTQFFMLEDNHTTIKPGRFTTINPNCPSQVLFLSFPRVLVTLTPNCHFQFVLQA
jgi:hypothetical protein